MTEAQLTQCKTCLNRKRGSFAPQDICNLRGHVWQPEHQCSYFQKDATVVTSTEEKKLLLKPNVQRATSAIVMVLIIMLLDMVSGLSSYFQLGLLHELKNGVSVTDSAIEANDTREQIIGLIYILALLTSAIFFIQWFRRAYYNLHIRTGNCEHSDGWAAGSWFVPVICLYRPYTMMKELYIKTDKLQSRLTDTQSNTNTTIVSIWWGLWILSNYIGNYVIKLAFKEDTLDNLVNATTIEMGNSLLGIPLAIITVYMIKTYSDKEAALLAAEEKLAS